MILYHVPRHRLAYTSDINFSCQKWHYFCIIYIFLLFRRALFSDVHLNIKGTIKVIARKHIQLLPKSESICGSSIIYWLHFLKLKSTNLNHHCIPKCVRPIVKLSRVGDSLTYDKKKYFKIFKICWFCHPFWVLSKKDISLAISVLFLVKCRTKWV